MSAGGDSGDSGEGGDGVVGAGGEGSTRNRHQIMMLLPGDAHNTLTKCSSKNWNTLGDDLVTDRIQELLSHLFAMKYEMQSNVIRS